MLRTLLLIISLIFLTGCATNYAERSEGRQFIHQMVTKHQFDQQQLTLLFTDVEPDQRIINIMKKPHEKVMPWYAYRSIFLTPQRAQEGALFWRQHEKALAYAQQKYGVPPEIIVSILGVETRYGKIQGTYQTLRSLATLSFDYPPRAKFFRGELEQFLLLTRELPLDPRMVMGSYAGALGEPQFMPSSYRRYAVAYRGDKLGDLFSNNDDVIISIANYLKINGWQPQGKIAVAVKQKTPAKPPAMTLYDFPMQNGSEYWLTYPKFAVIMRYNISPYYAMVVYQLSEQIKKYYQKSLQV